MELLTQWMMAVLFAVSPLIGYWLYTLAPQEVEVGRYWLYAALFIVIVAVVYSLFSRQKSMVVVLSASISLGLLAKELFQRKVNRVVGKKSGKLLVRVRLMWCSVWFFILLMGFEGFQQGIIEVSSAVILAGLIMGSLVQDKYSAIVLSVVPLILSFFESLM